MLRDADFDNPLRDDEFPDDDDVVGDAGSIDLVECPSCGKMIAEFAQQCPHCKTWVTTVGEARRRLRTWRWPVAAGGLILVILWLWHGIGC